MLISPQYLQEQINLHKTGKYGTASLQFGQVISNLIDRLNSRSILDYGCGSMRNLLKVLEPENAVQYQGYDPAVPEYDAKSPADLVVCIDVLEHIEPDLLDNVLDDLKGLTIHWSFLTIHTGPAVKHLSDGRNAHLIQEPPAWWLPKLLGRWDLQMFSATPHGFHVLLKTK